MNIREKVASVLAKQPRLLSVEEVAGLLNCSTRHVYRMKDSGSIPAPVRVGSLVRWRGDVIQQWMEAGCPKSVP